MCFDICQYLNESDMDCIPFLDVEEPSWVRGNACLIHLSIGKYEMSQCVQNVFINRGADLICAVELYALIFANI